MARGTLERMPGSVVSWRVVAASTVALAALTGWVAISRAAPAVTSDWRVEPPAEPRAIEGYASRVSVAPGDRVQLYVSTRPVADYRIELYRIGWYGGAGGELVGCIPSGCEGTRLGVEQRVPAPDAATGELRAGWGATDEIVVPDTWLSGYYRAKLVLTSGEEAGASAAIPLVVRTTPQSSADILVVAGVNTWQAYNDWGGLSLYSDPKAAVKVSFDRPYAAGLDKPELDFPVARFLDQFGYDVEYTTEVDVDGDPGQLLRHRLVVVPGHSEYWTKALRDGLEHARNEGVSLAFLGGNTGYWQIRYADADRRVLEEHRSAATDPHPSDALKTVRWRDQPVDRSECKLVGVQWQGGDDAVDPGPHGYRVIAKHLDDPWFRDTGFTAGDVVRGAVGDEWDALAPECIGRTPALTVLFHYQGKATPQLPGRFTSTFHSTNADVVRYRAPSGATVLAVGSIAFGWTITGPASGEPVADGVTSAEHPPDSRMQRFVRNAFDGLLAVAYREAAHATSRRANP
jgi:N,N-dimethylformamidase beta subunit-like, C-terminal